MSDVWLGILNRFIEKYLNVKGGPTVVDFNPAVQLEIPILIGVEERYHQGWSRFALALTITGGAAQNGAIELHNPLGSSVVAVVERVSGRSTTIGNTSFNLSFQAGPASIADFGTAQTAINLDGRSTTGSSMILTSSTNAVGFAKLIWSDVSNSTEVQFIQTVNQEFTLIPGSALILLDNVVADTAVFSIMWRERLLESSELT